MTAAADAETLLRCGDPAAALTALQGAVRADPSSPKLRIFLFQLLCVLGDWNRAIAQLKLSAELDAEAIPMAQAYREAIICEVFREKVFAGEKQPLVFGEPQDWVAGLIEALRLQALGRSGEAADLRARAFEAAPASPGSLNATPFAWIADADMRLGPVLETIINGKYYWLPFNRIATMAVEPPADLRDAVWTAAHLTFANGGNSVALIPTRYAGTIATGTDAEKLARATGWTDLGGDCFAGAGQRLLATDSGETALLDLRTLEFEPVAAESACDG